MSSSMGQSNGKVIFLVHFKPDNIERLKMPTHKRVLQEWKKSFKVRLVFGHSKIPMEVRETFKKDLQVTTTFTLRLIWCYPGRRKISSFPSKKLNFFFFPHAEFLLFCCQKQSIIEERSTKKQMYMKQKRNPSKFQSNVTKIEGKNVNLGFNPHVKSWVIIYKKG